MMKKCFGILVSICLISFCLFGSDEFIQKIMQEEEAALKARIQKMKNEKDSLFFAKTSQTLQKQEEIAGYEIEQIKTLSDSSGFGSPDYPEIYEHIKKILRFAPDTAMAERAHREIHSYYLGLIDGRNDYESAIEALESYLAKYSADDLSKKEAYDKLSNLWKEEENWKRSLFYSQKCLDIQEDYPRLLNKAQALIELEQYKTAKELLERIVKESPDSVQSVLAGKMMDKLSFDTNASPDKYDYKETVMTMRHIALAIAVYYLDKTKYPEKLEDLYPQYLPGDAPITDAWGHPILLKISDDGQTFLLGSGGSDGKFNGFDQSPGLYKEMSGRDIIHSDTNLLLGPEGMEYQ